MNLTSPASPDVLILGAGPSGSAQALSRAAQGAAVIIVDSAEPGGRHAHTAAPLLALRAHALDRREEASLPELREVVDQAKLRAIEESTAALRDAGVSVLRGAARFTGEREVFISRVATEFTADTLILAPGRSADIPPIQGLIDALPLTVASLLRLRELPESILIIGAGTEGALIADTLTLLGVRVHLVDREIPETLAQAHRGTTVTAIMRRPDGDVMITLSDGLTLRTAEVLIATGHSARTLGIGLDLAGVRLSPRGEIFTHPAGATTAPGILAFGSATTPLSPAF